jgi:DNA mismatch repair protein MutS2
MDKHSLRLLEWPAIQEMVAAEAGSPIGIETARSLSPRPTLDEARQVRDEIGEFRILLAQDSAPPFDRLADIREAVGRSRPEGSVLPPMDLVRVGDSLETAGAIRRVIGNAKGVCPRLHGIASGLDGQPELVAAIRHALEETGAVRDAASRELGDLRRRLHELRDRIQARLQSLVTDPRLQPSIAEPIITIRNDRYVIPVKANARGALKGVVQDRSASGVTVFVEPQEIVELNNQLRLLERDEAEEVRKVLARLTAELRPRAEAIIRTMQLAAELDARCAAARLADRLSCSPPSLTEGGPLVLVRARHPLLAAQSVRPGGPEVVPIDLRVGGDFDALLITGPNTGGKTVALKTAGLLSLMACAGLHLPASGDSEVPFFHGVMADIGDEQSIEQSLSTFSSHIGTIRRIVEAAGPGTLVLLDELGAGTDPAEGACLGIAILDHLLGRGALVIATSHLDAIKAHAYAHPRIENGCVEFDLDTLRPLYRFSIGLSGRSHALSIAARIGLPSSVIQRARDLLGDGDQRLRTVLERLEAEERRLSEEGQALARQVAEAEQARGEVEAERSELRIAAERLGRDARRKVEVLLSEARSEIDRLLDEVKSSASRAQAIREARRQLGEVRQRAEAALGDLSEEDTAPCASPGEPLRPGQQVRIKGLDQLGTISGGPTAAGLVEVQFPLGKVRLPVEAVVQGGATRSDSQIDSVRIKVAEEETPAELNLIGCDADEATRRLDRYIGEAFLAGFPTVRVVHGKGAGILRRAVAEFLRDHPLVVSVRPAGYRDGGIGATIVELHPRGAVTGGAA